MARRGFLSAAIVLLLGAAAIAAVGHAWTPLGAVLYAADPGLLNAAQAGVQRYLAPWLWDEALLPVLERPAWVLPAVVGIAMAALAAIRRGRA